MADYFSVANNQATWLNLQPDMNIITCFTYEKYIMEFKSIARKFRLAVSFTIVDLKFLVLNTVAAKTYVCKGKQNLWIVSPLFSPFYSATD